ncbi:MAG: BamA/TamA family outer membrane protein [bacterium]|nr:BamA/TamA family outer membrane protein [bacterium]
MDLRSYRAVPGGVLAARLRGQWVGEAAAFHDRLYLGGLYSLRGFSTGALSPPGGDTWQWAGSLEYRSPILSDARGTKLAGVLFVDAGAGGAGDVADPYTGMAVGAGYGVRMRVRWLDWIGVDVGFPLTERTLDMRFQGHASIGWSF